MQTEVSIDVEETRVAAILLRPPEARHLYVFAHGAGAGMRHASMTAIANDLAARGIASLRYQFPYMERGSKRPDAPSLCHAAVRAAVATAALLTPELPLFAGGRSFGGRMTAQAQALAPLPQIRGLVFLGFPLHPPRRPSTDRAHHLFGVRVPMLFVQGSRDELAELTLLRPLVEQLGAHTTLKVLEHADHSFHAPVKSGRKDVEVRAEAVDCVVDWMERVATAAASVPT